ncbi:Mobile element protein [Pseudomonas synxantha]|nr:IS66 family transposase [Pseudomonas synxantha]AZE67274.1 Mobile element protein [Pseudomonas synxantha]
MQTGGRPDKPVFLFDYSTSRAQEVPTRLLDGYRGYVMTDDYVGCNALGAQESGTSRKAMPSTTTLPKEPSSPS